MVDIEDVRKLRQQAHEPGVDLPLLLAELDELVEQIKDEAERRHAGQELESLVMMVRAVEEPEE